MSASSIVCEIHMRSILAYQNGFDLHTDDRVYNMVKYKESGKNLRDSNDPVDAHRSLAPDPDNKEDLCERYFGSPRGQECHDKTRRRLVAIWSQKLSVIQRMRLDSLSMGSLNVMGDYDCPRTCCF